MICSFRFGFVVQPTGAIENISDADAALKSLLSGKDNEHTIETQFHVDGMAYIFIISRNEMFVYPFPLKAHSSLEIYNKINS